MTVTLDPEMQLGAFLDLVSAQYAAFKMASLAPLQGEWPLCFVFFVELFSFCSALYCSTLLGSVVCSLSIKLVTQHKPCHLARTMSVSGNQHNSP